MSLDVTALDAALTGGGLRDYFRGISDARRYAEIRETGTGWIAVPADGADDVFVEPVNADYLDGLRAGGCTVSERGSVKRAA